MLSDAELKRIAHQAEINTFSTESLRRFEQAILSHAAQRVRSDEREACARVCEKLSLETDCGERATALDKAAAAIRARKEKE